MVIYHTLRVLARWGFWVNFRHVYLEHRERIPAGYHVIFALNHPTAFMEPVICGVHVSPRCWYLLRGDKFATPAARWMLAQIQNLPIYNQRVAGSDALRKNIRTMDFATDQVVAGQPTVILAEGRWADERRLRPIQRGTARMLMQAYKKAPDKPIAIVPGAVNYTAYNEFRSAVTITYGEPILAGEYAEAYREDSRGTVDAITEELERRLRADVVHVADPKRDDLAEALLPIIQHNYPDPGVPPVRSHNPYRRAQWAAVERLNDLHEADAETLRQSLRAYGAALAEARVTDSGLALPRYASAWRAMALLLLSPIAAFGWLANALPAYLAQARTDRMRLGAQFYGSVRFGLGLVLWMVYILVLTVASAFAVGWYALLLPPLLAFAGYGFLVWSESLRLWLRGARAGSLDGATREQLLAMRRDILSAVGQ